MGSKTNWACLAGGGVAGYMAAKTWQAIRNHQQGKGKVFVVVGAGFAGLSVASTLAKLLPGADNGEIILIDENRFLLFTPMLTEVAGGDIEARHIIHPLDQVSRRIQFVHGKVTEIDLASTTVHLGSRQYRPDHLIIALGSVTNFHGIPGLEEAAIPMKRLDDATAVYARILSCLEEASRERDPEKRRELLTFVVAGGGFSGVETMAALNDCVRRGIRSYPRLLKEEIRTILIDPADRLLEELTPELAAYAKRALEHRGVETRMKKRVVGATKTYVDLDGGERVPTRTLIWTAGVQPNPIAEQVRCEKSEHGAIKVDACCRVPAFRGVWALGDCAEIPRAHHKAYAPTAQNATREGSRVRARSSTHLPESLRWSGDARASPEFTGITFPARSPGRCGARHTSRKCPARFRNRESSGTGSRTWYSAATLFRSCPR
jgi:NADH dehydrogenase